MGLPGISLTPTPPPDPVWGNSGNPAVAGVSGTHTGAGQGVQGTSVNGDGVYGETKQPFGVSAGVRGIAHGLSPGVYAESKGGGPGISAKGNPAGSFDGDVQVSGNLTVAKSGLFRGDLQVNGNLNMTTPDTSDITLSDCAEDFDVSAVEKIEPGAVMVIEQDGALRQSAHAYDKRVAGVISGAGDYRPGIILGKRQSQHKRMPIALLGKVYCKVDAEYSAIEVGDPLTTSPTPGHAMKAEDPLKAFGAVIGKALRPLQSGKGLVPILIALQ